MRTPYYETDRKPVKVFAGTDRDHKAPVKEGDVPAYFRWDDGSEYEVTANEDGSLTRRYRGPLFGVRWGWVEERV